jgi:hypothetical protein
VTGFQSDCTILLLEEKTKRQVEFHDLCVHRSLIRGEPEKHLSKSPFLSGDLGGSRYMQLHIKLVLQEFSGFNSGEVESYK